MSKKVEIIITKEDGNVLTITSDTDIEFNSRDMSIKQLGEGKTVIGPLAKNTVETVRYTTGTIHGSLFKDDPKLGVRHCLYAKPEDLTVYIAVGIKKRYFSEYLNNRVDILNYPVKWYNVLSKPRINSYNTNSSVDMDEIVIDVDSLALRRAIVVQGVDKSIDWTNPSYEVIVEREG